MTDSDVQVQWNYRTDPPDMQLKTVTVRDESRSLTFTGVKLASISSKRDDRPRWTAIDLYRTKGGAFIAYRVGRSNVVHEATCDVIAGKRLPGPEGYAKQKASRAAAEVPVACVACTICRPDIEKMLHSDPAALRYEVDRHWTTMTADVEQLYQDLHTTRRGERSISYLARTLLVNAAENDPQISSLVETHKMAL
ncbi:hypothetical protein PP301_gp109 [Gordonia phage GMA2]|uniref:Uncharacterized protein n=1 Tax=Gordonia phage GMA2 TaxID=1647283 RepID=A0A0K0N783_9CAUD|nr:hypothetical protein PP301_gp109 [Gordonia phage GMA2]AKJ72613.1 hypothetical protein GMA2_75 [Gordonia phage GMA2]